MSKTAKIVFPSNKLDDSIPAVVVERTSKEGDGPEPRILTNSLEPLRLTFNKLPRWLLVTR
jgi:hypothetical protein